MFSHCEFPCVARYSQDSGDEKRPLSTLNSKSLVFKYLIATQENLILIGKNYSASHPLESIFLIKFSINSKSGINISLFIFLMDFEVFVFLYE